MTSRIGRRTGREGFLYWAARSTLKICEALVLKLVAPTTQLQDSRGGTRVGNGMIRDNPPPQSRQRDRILAPCAVARAILALALAAVLSACSPANDPGSRLETARKHLAANEVDAAVVVLKSLLVDDSENVAARVLLGRTYVEIEEPQAAEKELSRALELGAAREEAAPAFVRALLMQRDFDRIHRFVEGTPGWLEALEPQRRAEVVALVGHTWFTERKYERAEKAYQEALALAPSSPEGQLGMAWVAATRGDAKDSRDRLAALVVAHPNFIPARQSLGDLELAEQNFASADEIYSAVLAQRGAPAVRLRRAHARLGARNYDGALADFRALTARRVKHPAITLGLAQLALLRDGDVSAAQALAHEALTLDRDFAPARYMLGLTAYLKGDLEQAAVHLRSHLELVPTSKESAVLLASVLLQRPDGPPEAKELLNAAVVHHPNDTRLKRAMLRVQLATGNYQDAIKALEAQVIADPASSVATLELGLVQTAYGDQDAGAANLRRAFDATPESAAAARYLFEYLIAKKRTSEALATARRHTAASPDQPTGYVMEGTALLMLGKTQEAAEAFASALERSHENFFANSALARLALQEGDRERAKGNLQAILSGDPTNLPAILALSALAIAEERYDDGMAFLRQGIRGHPTVARLSGALAVLQLRTGDAPGARKTIDEALERTPEDAGLLLQSARLYLAARQTQQAVRTVDRLVAGNPDSADAQALRAQIATLSGDRAEIERHVERTLSLDPENVVARVLRARLNIRDGRLDEAQNLLSAVERTNATHPEVLGLAGDLAMVREAFEEATVAYRQALQALPSVTLLQRLVKARLGAKDLAGAESDLEQWLRTNPRDAATMASLAEIRMARGLRDAALETYQQVLGIDPENVQALNNLAWELRGTEPRRALEYSQRAVEAAARHPAVLDTHAMVLLDNGDVDEADRVVLEARLAAPNVALFAYHHAMVRARAGDRSGAVAILESILESPAETSRAIEGEVRQLLKELKP